MENTFKVSTTNKTHTTVYASISNEHKKKLNVLKRKYKTTIAAILEQMIDYSLEHMEQVCV